MALPNIAAVAATLLLQVASVPAYQVMNHQPEYRNIVPPPQITKDAEERDYR